MSLRTNAKASAYIAVLILGFCFAVFHSGCKKDNTTNNQPPPPPPPPSTVFGVFTETQNRGSSWSGIDSLLFAKKVYGGSFTIAANIFIIVGQDTVNKAAIWISTDNGFNWSTALTTSSTGAFEDVTHTQGYSRLVAVTDDGAIYMSMNNGVAWQLRFSSGPGLKAVDFFESSNVGVAVGIGGRIVRCIDNGATWAPVSSGTTEDLFGVHCISSSDTIVAVGAAATVVRSTDAGLTWIVSTLPSPTILKAVSFSANSDGRFGVAVGTSGARFRTTDGGVTWQDKTNITSVTYEDVRVSDDGTLSLAIYNQSGLPKAAWFTGSNDRGHSWGGSGSRNWVWLYKLVFRTFNAADPYGFAVGIPNN